MGSLSLGLMRISLSRARQVERPEIQAESDEDLPWIDWKTRSTSAGAFLLRADIPCETRRRDEEMEGGDKVQWLGLLP